MARKIDYKIIFHDYFAVCCKRSAFNNLLNTISLIYCRHLALVNGICTAGQYSGTIVFSQVIQLVVEQKGLSGTFRILAGIASVMVFVALVYRQPPDTPGGTSPEKLCVKRKDTFDFSVLKDKSFFIFLLGTSLYAFGSYVPATHAVSTSQSFFSLRMAFFCAVDRSCQSEFGLMHGGGPSLWRQIVRVRIWLRAEGKLPN